MFKNREEINIEVKEVEMNIRFEKIISFCSTKHICNENIFLYWNKNDKRKLLVLMTKRIARNLRTVIYQERKGGMKGRWFGDILHWHNFWILQD